jgi:hypothetical protein
MGTASIRRELLQFTQLYSVGDNYGIAALTAEISGDGFVENDLPQGEYGNGLTGRRSRADLIGFTQYSSGYSYSSGGSTMISGSQDTTASSGVVVLYGAGQTGGNIASNAPAGFSPLVDPTDPVYQAELLVADGTFAPGTPPSWASGSNDSANVFVSNTSAVTEAANIVLETQTLTG